MFETFLSERISWRARKPGKADTSLVPKYQITANNEFEEGQYN